MEFVPIREYIDQRFDRIDAKLDQLEDKIDDHTHGDKVPWAALVPILISLVVAVGLFS